MSTPSSPLSSPSVHWTTNRRDWWMLGGQGAIILGSFLPTFTFAAHHHVSYSELGFLAWLTVIALIAVMVITALPDYRPRWWRPVMQWLSAAAVGAVGVVFIAGLTIAHLLNQAINSFSNSSLFGSFMSSGFSIHVSIGSGLLLAFFGSLVWTVVAWNP